MFVSIFLDFNKGMTHLRHIAVWPFETKVNQSPSDEPVIDFIYLRKFSTPPDSVKAKFNFLIQNHNMQIAYSPLLYILYHSYFTGG